MRTLLWFLVLVGLLLSSGSVKKDRQYDSECRCVEPLVVTDRQ